MPVTAYARENMYLKTLTPERRVSESGHRFYSPTFGRWISRDPAGVWGDYTIYSFVDNAPSHAVDAIGLITCQMSNHEDHGSIEAKKGTTVTDTLAELVQSAGQPVWSDTDYHRAGALFAKRVVSGCYVETDAFGFSNFRRYISRRWPLPWRPTPDSLQLSLWSRVWLKVDCECCKKLRVVGQINLQWKRPQGETPSPSWEVRGQAASTDKRKFISSTAISGTEIIAVDESVECGDGNVSLEFRSDVNWWQAGSLYKARSSVTANIMCAD